MSTAISLPISHDAAARAARRVYKYVLRVDDSQSVEMPSGAEILCVQTQRGDVCLWALVNPNNSPEERRFRIAGTGHPADECSANRYIGTVQMMSGALVWHVFEVSR